MTKRPNFAPEQLDGRGHEVCGSRGCGCLDWVARVNCNLLFGGSLGILCHFQCGCIPRCRLVYEVRLAATCQAATSGSVPCGFDACFTRFKRPSHVEVIHTHQGIQIPDSSVASQWVGKRCHPRQTTRQQHFAPPPLQANACAPPAAARTSLCRGKPLDRHRDNQNQPKPRPSRRPSFAEPSIAVAVTCMDRGYMLLIAMASWTATHQLIS